MAYDYAGKASMAQEKIGKYGCQVVMRRSTKVINPVNGLVDETISEWSVQALLTQPDEKSLAAGNIHIGDMCLLVASNEYGGPEVGDTVEVKGAEWRVFQVATVEPGAVLLLNKAYIRRS